MTLCKMSCSALMIMHEIGLGTGTRAFGQYVGSQKALTSSHRASPSPPWVAAHKPST